MLVEALGNIARAERSIRLSEVFASDPAALIAAAEELGFEGIVAKRKDSLYESGKRSEGVGQVQGQPWPRVCYQWLHVGESHRRNHCGLFWQR
jgi:hypothetical protein